MSKTITAPEPEAVSVNVPAAPMAPAVETVATPEPVAAKAPASKAAAKKPAVKRAVKPAAKAIKTAPPAAAVDTEKIAKTDALPPPAKPVKESKAKKIVPKKPKLVRDSFTFPENDYALLAELKQRALKAGLRSKRVSCCELVWPHWRPWPSRIWWLLWPGLSESKPGVHPSKTDSFPVTATVGKLPTVALTGRLPLIELPTHPPPLAPRNQPAISSLLGIRPATLTASSTTKAGVVMIG